jgi:hypothetical protein
METEQIGMSGSDSGTSAAKQGIEEAKKISNSARRRVYMRADEKKAQLFEGPGSWLEKIEGLGGKGIVPEGVLEKVREVADTLRSRSTEELVDDFGMKARQRPGAFILGALAVGFIGARLLKDVGSNP